MRPDRPTVRAKADGTQEDHPVRFADLVDVFELAVTDPSQKVSLEFT